VLAEVDIIPRVFDVDTNELAQTCALIFVIVMTSSALDILDLEIQHLSRLWLGRPPLNPPMIGFG
jgi:hypothetical protein